ncbi:tetratricopeptide repeat protein [Tamlana sp. 62-3]|uniref:Tetratricopeptide repeat protein n=1 Tax=Neotamlana sargassicola TaxID=2883125 RepID=A0A9X1I5M0_9FLAO|nr:tetratricopeptide repeat protein [Tamlana sargassicola]MCB4807717.1 tetratricopeptide repeat protein [Tamlana sargassicola]
MKRILVFLLIPVSVFGQINTAEMDAYFKNKQYKKAENVLTDFIKSNPENLEALEYLGDAYGYQERWDNAISIYKKLVNFKPKEANYHYKYGGALGMKALQNKFKAIGFIGDIKKAFITAAELDKDHINVRWALVELYVQLPLVFGGSSNTALTYANELENLSKVDGYLAKGYVYEYDDEPELAEKYYKMAIKTGGSLVCFDKLTQFYENKNKPGHAIKNIEEAHEKHQRNAMHYQIGKVAAEYNVELDKGEKCLIIYLENYSSKDGVPKAWANYRLAQIHYHKKNKEQALKYINLALNELPKIEPFKTHKQKVLNM